MPRSGREAPRDPRIAAGANGLPHSGPRPAGHVSRRHGSHGSNDGGAAVAVLAEEMGLTARVEEA